MRLLNTKVHEISFNDHFDRLPSNEEVSLRLTLTHILESKNANHLCKSVVTIEHEDFLIINATFYSTLQGDKGDSPDKDWLHKESINLVYPQIRLMISSVMAASMLRPITIPDIPPETILSND